MTDVPAKFFCVKEAAVYSGLSLAELYRLARLKKLPHFYEGRQLRFAPADLQRYLEVEPPNRRFSLHST